MHKNQSIEPIEPIEEDIPNIDIDEYTLYLVINLKKTTALDTLKQLIRDSAQNCECDSEYFTHETEGTNNRITKNNIIYIVTFTIQQNLESYIDFIKTIHEIEIESIFHNDIIVYGSKNYLKSLNHELQDPQLIKNQLSKSHKNTNYKSLFDVISK